MEYILKNYRSYSENNPLKLTISDGVTAIVGANNSGKSSILKSLYELRALLSLFVEHKEYTRTRKGFDCSINGISHHLDIFHKFNNNIIEGSIRLHNKKLIFEITRDKATNGRVNIVLKDGKEFTSPNFGRGLELTNDLDIVNTFEGRIIDNFTDLFAEINSLSKSIYFASFRNTINVGANQSYYDMAVGDAFIKSWHELTTSSDPYIRKQSLQVKDDLKDIFGYSNLDIISSPGEHKIVTNINGETYTLSDLGAGISQFIIVFINAAIKQPDFILIDEPELNLHPKLQIEFINRLLQYSKRGIIFATHNLGLAHSVADRIYSVTKKENESIVKPFENTPKYLELLGELNFSNYQSVGFNKLLLVEGPTEVKVFSILLRKIGKYKDVLLWPLGGSGLINAHTVQELNELQRLGPDIKKYCWIDSEKKSQAEDVSPPRKQFQENCDSLGIKTRISDLRSIECYFPEQAIKKVYTKGTKIGPYDEIPKWLNKGSNWRVAQEIDLNDLKGTDLFNFLSDL